MDTLETPRLVIRPFTVDELDEAHRLLDLDLEWGGPGITVEERRRRLSFQVALAGWQDTGCLYGDRAIVLKESGELIGICGFRPWLCTAAERALYDPARLEREQPGRMPELGVGYALASRARGQGHATEAVRALIAHAFGALEVQRIVALTFRGNAESVGVMRRAGMTVGFNPDPEAVYPWAVGMIENSRTQA